MGLVKSTKFAWINLVVRITPRCADMARLMSQSLDRKLPWSTRWRMKLHFTICVWCERYGHHLRLMRTMCAHSEDKASEQMNISMKPEFRDRLKERLREEEGSKR